MRSVPSRVEVEILQLCHRTSIESLLRILPDQNADSAYYDSALGAALIAAMNTLVSDTSL